MTIHLCFHGVGVCSHEREAGEAKYWVTDDIFLRILYLAAERPNVAISFDDGNRSDADIALPALLERGLKATFFPLAGRLDDPASLDTSDIRTLVKAGMTIGTHGWAHVPWRGLDAADRQREFVDARDRLSEASDRRIDYAALPLGRYDRAVLGQLKSAAYRRVYTSDRYRARAGAWLQARFSITAQDTVDSVRNLLTQPRWPGEARNHLASLVKRVR